MKFEEIAMGRAAWPKRLHLKNQRTIVLGLASHDDGVSLGKLQAALLQAAKLSKTRPALAGRTSRGDKTQGLGYVDAWFVPSWVPRDVRIEKSVGYDYCVPSSRVRLVPTTQTAVAKLARVCELIS